MENFDLMGRFIGAGLACFALLGAAIGVGNIFAAYLEGAMRNPSAAVGQTGNLFVGAGLAEAAGLFGFLIAILLVLGIGAQPPAEVVSAVVTPPVQ